MLQHFLIGIGFWLLMSTGVSACSWKVGQAEGGSLECEIEPDTGLGVECYADHGTNSNFYGSPGMIVKWSGDGGSKA